MIKIGLTGSIGMGKTETAKMFAENGVSVFDSDAAVHDLLARNGKAVKIVADNFPGVEINGAIDRKLLGNIVFNDECALKKLENILHPMVHDLRLDFVAREKNKNNKLVLFDIPLLYEKGYEKECDVVVVVTAPYEVQRDRVLSRPRMTEERFEEILEKQMPDNEKRQKADFIVETDQGFDHARTQVNAIIEQLRN